MRCILEGHRPQVFDGHGEYAGKQFWVCVDCGKTEQYFEGHPPYMVMAAAPMLIDRVDTRH